jgi:ubiquinone/menaquinone biosynthesis C-methylase UbiE
MLETTEQEQPKTELSPELPEICNYEGSGYRTDFWEGKGRDYEDAVERVALRRLLPRSGARYIEFGAGFGRLIDMAAAYNQVVVFDYSRSLLQQAQERLGMSERFLYVAADLNHLPFAPNSFDVAAMIRVMHHMPHPQHVLAEIRATLTPQARFILEFANKLNLKAILRYLVGAQEWNPFDPAPVEFVKLNFDFHPEQMRAWLDEAGFRPEQTLAVSWLRAGFLKRRLPLNALRGIDSLLQYLGPVLPLAPSVFIKNRTTSTEVAQPVVPADRLFVNPMHKESVLVREGDVMRCPQTGMRWAVRDGIYDFKEPIGE